MSKQYVLVGIDKEGMVELTCWLRTLLRVSSPYLPTCHFAKRNLILQAELLQAESKMYQPKAACLCLVYYRVFPYSRAWQLSE